MFSPFERDFGFKSIPEVFRLQYLYSVDEPYTIIFEGNADHVWHQPKWLLPFFWVLIWFQIFFPETGENIPTQLHIIGGRDSSSQPFHRWNRTFHFKRARFFNAVMSYDRKVETVVERMGPLGILQIYWKIDLISSNQLKISSIKCCLNLRVFKLFLPVFLYPSVVATETALADDKIYVELIASHPWLGNIFGYSGTFLARKVELTNERLR